MLILLALAGVVLLVAGASAAVTFSDGFESGSFSSWSSVSTGGDGTAVVQSSIVQSGTSAARLTATTSTGSFATVRKTLPAARAAITVSGWFNLQTDGTAGNVPLVRLFAADGSRAISVYRQNADADRVYVQRNGGYHPTTGKLPLKTWAKVDVSLSGGDTSSAVLTVRINGTSVYSSTSALPSLLTVQIGNDTKQQPYSMVVDDVSFDEPSDTPPPPPPPPPPPGDPVLVGAGDIAGCNNPGDEATAALLDGIPGTVFTLGDNVYPSGTLALFNSCYEPSWGRHKARTRPVAGNHEYDPGNANGYFDYFGASAGERGKGYYSYDIGAWHVVVLNSNCSFVGGCGAGSAQEQWLRADLAANATSCTVALMHHPRYSSGTDHGSTPAMQPFFQALYDAGAEIVLGGHEHNYERFMPVNATGSPDLSFGVRQFVVGSGGFSHYPTGPPLAISQVANSDTFGVLKLTLHDGSYDWQFVPEAGKTFTDGGTASCHGAPPPPPPPADFADGFESGDFAAWTSRITAGDGTAVVQTAIVKSGTRAARLKMGTTSGSKAYVRKTFPAAGDLTASGWFNLQAQGASGGNVPFLRLYDASGNRLASLFRQNAAADQLYVQHSGAYNTVNGKLPLATWGRLALRLKVAGTTSTVEVYLNGTRIYQTTTASLGTAGVAAVQIGNDTAAQAFDVVVDDVSTSTTPPA